LLSARSYTLTSISAGGYSNIYPFVFNKAMDLAISSDASTLYVADMTNFMARTNRILLVFAPWFDKLSLCMLLGSTSSRVVSNDAGAQPDSRTFAGSDGTHCDSIEAS
jgi:hypothetical protein